MKSIRHLLCIGALATSAFSQSACSNELLSAKGIEEEMHSALEANDYGRAIELTLSIAEAGDPEFQFTLGHLALLWLEADSPKEPPKYTLEEAVSWIRMAAEQGIPQAAEFLRSGYEWGRYNFPKDAELEACWRKVEWNEQPPDVCMEIEKEAGIQPGFVDQE